MASKLINQQLITMKNITKTKSINFKKRTLKENSKHMDLTETPKKLLKEKYKSFIQRQNQEIPIHL